MLTTRSNNLWKEPPMHPGIILACYEEKKNKTQAVIIKFEVEQRLNELSSTVLAKQGKCTTVYTPVPESLVLLKGWEDGRASVSSGSNVNQHDEGAQRWQRCTKTSNNPSLFFICAQCSSLRLKGSLLKRHFTRSPTDSQMSSHKCAFVCHKTSAMVWCAQTQTHTRSSSPLSIRWKNFRNFPGFLPYLAILPLRRLKNTNRRARSFNFPWPSFRIPWEFIK